MVFGLFGAKCPVCGMKLGADAVERNGKKFCSEADADEFFRKEKKEQKHSHEGGHGCCH